ncbi:MAG TPA: malate synthase A [Thermoplasmata archaeon]|jgi:malate synthase
MAPHAHESASGFGPLATKEGPIRVLGTLPDRAKEILEPPAVAFLAMLHRRFEARRRELLAQRGGFRRTLAAGDRPGFLPETERVRVDPWTVPPPPSDLVDRRVEITGPVDRKMIINALNSGARVFMADFEDAHSPTWTATVLGQANVRDAVRRRITFTSPEGKEYRLNERVATLMVRPRGWHLDERHFEVDGRPISASLFDFGLFLFHNALELRRRGTGPYLYLPKMEHHLEARLWNDVFSAAEDALGLSVGTIRATALIETLPAAFQMDEILWELREHSVGLNCGRWDYLFSFIKQFEDVPTARFPDRSSLTMITPFLTAYSHLLIQTCHRRGAHAIGGMAAQIPIKEDPEANAKAIALVVADKEREVAAGHDGTWVAHPGLVKVAMDVFDRGMPTPNQISRPWIGLTVGADELLAVPTGPITPEGVRRNARAALLYLESWLRGIGCVPIDNLMEDAATAEIARTQLWQWVHHHARLEDGQPVNLARVREAFAEERGKFLFDPSRPATTRSLERAAAILDEVVLSPVLVGFITERAYPELGDPQGGVGE